MSWYSTTFCIKSHPHFWIYNHVWRFSIVFSTHAVWEAYFEKPCAGRIVVFVRWNQFHILKKKKKTHFMFIKDKWLQWTVVGLHCFTPSTISCTSVCRPFCSLSAEFLKHLYFCRIVYDWLRFSINILYKIVTAKLKLNPFVLINCCFKHLSYQTIRVRGFGCLPVQSEPGGIFCLIFLLVNNYHQKKKQKTKLPSQRHIIYSWHQTQL